MLRLNEKNNIFLKFLLVLFSIFLTAVIKHFGTSIMGEGPPLIFFIPVVILSGFIGGFWTGAIATIISGLVAIYFFMYPSFNFHVEVANDQVRLGIFAVIGVTISYLFERLHSQTYRLSQLNKTKDRFIATLGHELRVPLNRVGLIASDLIMHPNLPRDVRKGLREIQSSNEVQKVLINDVLDGAQAQHHKLACHLEYLELIPEVKAAISIVEADCQLKNISIRTSLPSDVVAVLADKIRLKQVLWNLLRNAIKFSPKNSIIKIVVQKTVSEEVVVEVSDAGIGLDSKNQISIFEPYHQAKRASKDSQGGLGLGLAICKEIIREHKGDIWVESEGLNKGCTFKFKLKSIPVKNEVTNDHAQMLEAINSLSKCILVIDDDLTSLMIIQKFFTKMGFKTLAASNFSDAKLVDPEMIDIIVSDFNLDDANGWDVLSHFKRLKPEIKVIALSGDNLSDRDDNPGKYAFDQQLVKPVNYKTLADLFKADLMH